ncbi:GNAT family N-acetyltransferase [Actinopolymorpha pittospori]|uniref:GNAT superfamily N-acetyltransferase n=1 Tax=Actinopolymorpha pittospori TaxID=648752 RepID=A0A927R7Q8_9ACTN|nr:GNAT family N-acetyltransferase [Actinopolymorpha pittospori]MBE1605852.1 GNAT superfamily N-acetyltransferase [Actinopolymorpha pittospori]
MLRIVTLTSPRDVAFGRWHEISVAVRRHDEVDPPLLGLDRQRDLFETDSSAQRRELLLAMQDECPVGAGEILLSLKDHAHPVEFAIWVLPDLRRRGIGSELLDHIRRRATEEAQTRMLTTVIGPPDRVLADAKFLERSTFTLANTMVGRTLRLPVGDAMLNELATKANARAGSYHIASWVGPCPGAYAERYARLRGLHLNDAQTGAVDVDRKRWDVARLREEEEQFFRSGLRVYTTAALDATSNLVAYTRVFVRTDELSLASQGQTLVVREHRGNRLGLAVKVANLRAVQAAEPMVNRIGTATAEHNSAMIAINQELGFQVHDGQSGVAAHGCVNPAEANELHPS